MKYQSTRDQNAQVSASKAIVQGISSDGGLFVPCEFPRFDISDIERFSRLTYNEIAQEILSKFLTDFSKEDIKSCVDRAYSSEKFGSDIPAPLSLLGDNTAVLELWHGPTCAFKDMALQILPHLLTVSSKNIGENKTTVILVATSGDTGKAALEGFKDVEGTQILVFYPVSGVSEMQRLQMVTQEGDNVGVCAIEGNFDDAQTGVKRIFADKEMAELLDSNHMVFSSANSINWGRLLPQIVYYFYTYGALVSGKSIKLGDEINFAVPTGNFGNILAGYYAKKMGLPVGKFICASNSNNVLTDFIKTGKYDRKRDFYTTASPSMDILISSNLERLLFDLSGSERLVKELMESLSSKGEYAVSEELLAKIKSSFEGGYCDDAKTSGTIKEIFEEFGYLCDTHTAVAVNVGEEYRKKSGDERFCVYVSTASPYKFPAAVLKSVSPEAEFSDEFEAGRKLSNMTNTLIPAPLGGLDNKDVRFTTVTKKEDMAGYIKNSLKI